MNKDLWWLLMVVGAVNGFLFSVASEDVLPIIASMSSWGYAICLCIAIREERK